MTLRNVFGPMALESTLKAVQRRTPDTDQQIEFANVGGETKPLYVGQAPPSTVPTALVWVIQKYTWSAAPTGTGTVPSQIQTRTGAWTDRALLFT